MTVDPAPQAASRSVNGIAATTRPKYVKSLNNLDLDPSGICRTRRAMGSSDGAMLDAIPAGLSRREKYFVRNSLNPQFSSKA